MTAATLDGERTWGEGRVFIEVIDNGIGITAEDQAHLFESFVQVDATLGRKYGGTGLGLVLAQRIAEMHGGNITVASTPGKGSRFTVQLPCSQEKL